MPRYAKIPFRRRRLCSVIFSLTIKLLMKGKSSAIANAIAGFALRLKVAGQAVPPGASYDMCFLVLLISSLQKEDAAVAVCSCPKHPITHKKGWTGPIVDYAADMNILLSYFQKIDSWNDDKNVLSLWRSKTYKEAAKEISEKYPKQSSLFLKALKAN